MTDFADSFAHPSHSLDRKMNLVFPKPVILVTENCLTPPTDNEAYRM